mgnify:CR=1 FL=1
MNQTLIFALFVMAMLIVVCVGYSASQAWRSLLVEQRLNQIKGSGDSRLVRWEDLLTLIARPLRRSRDLAAVERSMQQAGFIKPWQTDLFLLFRALVLIAAAVGGWLAIDIDPTHLVQKTAPAARLSVLAFCRGARSRMVPIGTGRTSSKPHSSFYPQSGRPAHDLYELRHEP